MGTRHTTAVKQDNKFKVSQYGQWDGHPEGTGVHILEFLKKIIKKGKLDQFRENVSKCTYLTSKDIEDKWVEMGAVRGDSLVSMDISEKFKEKYPHLHRSCGSDVLEYILKGPLELQEDLDFAGLGTEKGDDTFCEWCYIVDLDADRLDVYAGPANVKSKARTPIAVFNFDELPKKKHFVQIIDDLMEMEDE
jgi:hypothetical protein